MVRIITLLFMATGMAACTRWYNGDPCPGAGTIPAGFYIGEYVKDTFMQTDTSFTNREIIFNANENYDSISWKIGDDPRRFTNKAVALRFLTTENLSATLSAHRLNSDCSHTPFTSTQSLVLLTDNGTVISPLVGEYHGYNTDRPSDTFTVAVRFWKDPRYTWWSTGAYSIDNLPKGYRDTTKNINGVPVHEITGIISATGYKNMAYDLSGTIPAAGIKGYATLRRGLPDTLMANYTLIDTARLLHTGQLVYLKKQFIGLKK